MLTFDFSAIINLVISGLIGVFTSWIVTHWYYKKNSPSERILKEIEKALPNYFLPVLYPQFFSSESAKVLPDPPPPEDKDIPHVEYARLSTSKIPACAFVEVLLKVRDLGLNLENPSGIKIRDQLERDLAIKRAGMGFVTFKFMTDPLPQSGQCALTVTLEDSNGRHNVQSIPFSIC